MSLSASPSMGNPSCSSLDESACLPECFPITTPTESSPRKYPIVSGAMISYVFLFFSMPSWWMPDSCANALAPTMALCGCTAIPEKSFTILDAG